MPEPFLREITPGNLLSFGPNPEPIKLNQLNILIGANGSGKSNLIEVIHVLRSTPGDFRTAFRPGGVGEWIWHGSVEKKGFLNSISFCERGLIAFDIKHSLEFYGGNPIVEIQREKITAVVNDKSAINYADDEERDVYELREGNRGLIGGRELWDFSNFKEFPNSSVLKYSNIDQEGFLNHLSIFFSKIKIYREWQFGRNSPLRKVQVTDLRHEVLEEDFSNLAMHLNYLRSFPPVRRKLIEKLQNVFAGITDFDVSVVGGTAQIYLIEGDYRIPATRLSDGTLRYLCLLAILCNPEPQPLICLEEPELGLHPDLLSGIVEMIRECSERTQLIVTTHSETIVDAFSDDPESVLVCEKEDGITTMKRLSSEDLAVWLKDYSLGQLWSRGQIGGTRW